VTHRLPLVRAVLLHVQEHAGDPWIDLWIRGFAEDAVVDCVKLLEKLEYARTVRVFVGQREVLKGVELTANGRKLLAAARNEGRWGLVTEESADLAAELKSLADGASNRM